MDFQLRHFPMIVTMVFVIATLVFICLVEVPITIYTSTNLTFTDYDHGEKVLVDGLIILIVHALWYVVFLVLVLRRRITEIHRLFKERNAQAFDRRVRQFMVLWFLAPVMVVCFPILRPYSEDMNRFWWFNVRMTCYGILIIPFISWYFDCMDLHVEVEAIPIAIVDAVEAH
jgi:hypothetical protein